MMISHFAITIILLREMVKTMQTIERLEQIEKWLEAHRPDYHALLQAPAAENEISEAEERLHVQLSDAFKLLHQWHAGQRPREFTPLLFNLTFMTLPEIIEAKESLDHVAEFDQWKKDSWWPTWIPFLDNGGGDYLCFDLGGFKTGSTEQILWFDHETHEHEIVHPNLDDFLDDLYRRMLNADLNLG